MLWMLHGAWAAALPLVGSVDLVPTTAGDWPPPVPGLEFLGPKGVDGLALRGGLTPKAPVAWTATPPASAPWLVVAWSAREGTWGDAGAQVRFRYDSGEEVVTARLGLEIPLDERPASGPHTTPVAAGGRVVGVTALRNPRPDLPLREIGIESRRAAGALTLWAASTADEPPFPVAPADPPPAGFPFPLSPGGPALPQPEDLRVNGPAGAQGFVTVRDGHLALERGERVRFWGINLLSEASIPPREVGTALARQLAGAGFNLARLHHVDAPRVGLVRADRTADPATLFDQEKLDRFDWLVAELIRNGVYVLLEVATNRALSAVDGASSPDASVPNGHKLVPFFAPEWRDAYLGWTRAWLGRVNPHTGRRYADESGVAMVELVNENSISVNWFNGGLEDLSAPHRAALDARWNAFLAARYPDEAALRAAWTGSVNPGLLPGERWGAVGRAPVVAGLFENYPLRRREDLYDFYAGLDASFLGDVAAEVRGLGFRVPIVPGITYQSPMLARVQSAFDVVDIHFEWDTVGPEDTLRGSSLVEGPRAQGLFEKLAQAQVGKPFIASEINGAFPNPTTAELPFAYAALAAVQDWDALVWLNYTNGPVDGGHAGVAGMYELRRAATKWAQMGVASALFRSGAVPAAPGLHPVWRSEGAVKTGTVTGLRPPPVELRDLGFALAHRLREAYGPTPPTPRRGEVSPVVGWWSEASRFVVDDPRWQVVLGRDREDVAGEGAGPRQARFLDPDLEAFAATSLVSLDGAPFPSCGHALLTVAGTMRNEGMVTGAGGTTVLTWGSGEVRVVPVPGVVRFAWPRRPEVRPRAADGVLGPAVPVRPSGRGWWALETGDATSLWWEIR